MKFPIIVFQKEDTVMLSLDYPYLMGDIRFEDVAFKKTTIIDSLGDVYDVDGVKRDGNINIWYSIKLIGLIAKMKPIITNEVTRMSVTDLKIKIMNHVRRKQKEWKSLGSVSEIDDLVSSKTNFEDLIRIFR